MLCGCIVSGCGWNIVLTTAVICPLSYRFKVKQDKIKNLGKLIIFKNIVKIISKHYDSYKTYHIKFKKKRKNDETKYLLNTIDDIDLIHFFFIYWTADADHGK